MVVLILCDAFTHMTGFTLFILSQNVQLLCSHCKDLSTGHDVGAHAECEYGTPKTILIMFYSQRIAHPLK